MNSFIIHSFSNISPSHLFSVSLCVVYEWYLVWLVSILFSKPSSKHLSDINMNFTLVFSLLCAEFNLDHPHSLILWITRSFYFSCQKSQTQWNNRSSIPIVKRCDIWSSFNLEVSFYWYEREGLLLVLATELWPAYA